MRLALDLDGVAWAHPRLLVPLSRAVKAIGWQVGVITGHWGADLVAQDRERWKLLGYPAWDFYYGGELRPDMAPPAQWKPGIMQQYGVDYLIDDLEQFANLHVFIKQP